MTPLETFRASPQRAEDSAPYLALEISFGNHSRVGNYVSGGSPAVSAPWRDVSASWRRVALRCSDVWGSLQHVSAGSQHVAGRSGAATAPWCRVATPWSRQKRAKSAIFRQFHPFFPEHRLNAPFPSKSARGRERHPSVGVGRISKLFLKGGSCRAATTLPAFSRRSRGAGWTEVSLASSLRR